MRRKKFQKRALFFPLLQIASGHHHVADTLMRELQKCPIKINTHKIDILSYSYGKVEKLVSSTYLAWIKYFPKVYNWLYVQMGYKETVAPNRNIIYEALFSFFFRKLINKKDPCILFFTHSLPSHIASRLKQRNKLAVITVNVYTDFFVNRVWGIEGIDYHFVPSITVKNYLIEKGVKEDRIFITGIPVDPIFKDQNIPQVRKKRLRILVCGGNHGFGAVEQLLATIRQHNDIHYYVLCGKNISLYKRLLHLNKLYVTPLPFINCKKKMNKLYDFVDGVITKPGGVTVSECLMKKKPLFIYEPLPGQEKINKDQLSRLGIAMPIYLKDEPLEIQLYNFFYHQTKQKAYHARLDAFHQHLEKRPIHVVIEEILDRSLL